MKNLKLILSGLIVLALLSGLFVNNFKKSREISSQEFLFDTLCTITVYSKNDADAIAKAFDRAAQIHRLADFYNDESEVSKINRAKANEDIFVSHDTMNMLALAQEIYEKSDGAFDISIAPVSRLWKFDIDNPVPPLDEDIKAVLPLVNSKALLLDPTNMAVRKGIDNVQIDPGGIAKGYAADEAAKTLQGMGVENALIDFGGNIVALGENPKTENKKWRIGLQTPFAPTGEYSEIAEVDKNRAVVTSGTYQRYFEYNGTKFHHIINPKTGYPAKQSYESVTVVADNAATADCLATAIFVLGKEKGRALAKSCNAQVYFLP